MFAVDAQRHGRSFAKQGAGLARVILMADLVAGFVGVGLAFSAGPNTESFVAKLGAVMTLPAIVVAFIVTPIGFVISLAAMRQYAREGRRLPNDADEEPFERHGRH